MSSAHNVYQYGSTGLPVPSTHAGQNTQESYLAWKNFSPITLSNTTPTQFPNCACGHVKVFNPHGNDLVAVGGSGASDLPYFYPNNPGLARGTVIPPGTGHVFAVTNMNLLSAIALRNGDIIDPQAALSSTDFTTPTNDPAPNTRTIPPLTVTSTTPANGATAIVGNQIISIVFSHQIDPTTVNFNNITMSPAVTTSTIGMNASNNMQVDINPEGNNLAVGQTYTITVTENLLDINGINLAAPFTFSFSVGQVPGVLSVTPGNNTTGIGVNTTVAVVMTTIMDNTTITTSNVKLIQVSNSSTVTSTVSLGSDMQTITITPSSNLAFNTKYKVTLSNIKAAASIGNATISPNPYDGATVGPNHGVFTTSSSLTVTSVTPGNNAVNVATNTKVTIVMSSKVTSGLVNTSNVQLINVPASTTVVGTVSLGTDQQTITITPSSNLAIGTQYKVVIQNLQDLNGVTMIPSPWDGITQGPNSGVFTTVPPTLNVVSVTPGNNATNVSLTTSVVVVMNTAILPADMTSSNFQLLDEGNSNAQITCTLTLSGGNTTITMAPTPLLSNSDTYKVLIQNVHNTNNVIMSPNPWDGHTQGPSAGEFTTIPPTPNVVSVSPGSNATNVPVTDDINITMNTPIVSADINTTNIQLINTGTSIAFSTTVSQSSDIITINPTGNLANNTTYKVLVQNVHNTNGVVISPNPWDGASQGGGAGEFTTVPPIPNVVSVSPGSSQTGVAVNTTVVITMNTAVQPANATTSNVQLIQISNSTAVNCGLALSGGNTILTLTPNANLSNLTAYKVVVQNQTNTNGQTQSPNPWDGVSQSNAGKFTTKDFTSRYNVSQSSFNSCGGNGLGPLTGSVSGQCGQHNDPCDGYQNFGLGTCSDDVGVGFGAIASVANGLTAQPITKITIPQIGGDNTDYTSNNGNPPTGTVSIKIISGTTLKYTFSQTFTASSTGFGTLHSVNCGSCGSCNTGSFTWKGWSSVTLTDIGNTYTMAVGDIIVVAWSGTCQNTICVAMNTGGSPNSGGYVDGSNNINTLSNLDIAAQMWSSL